MLQAISVVNIFNQLQQIHKILKISVYTYELENTLNILIITNNNFYVDNLNNIITQFKLSTKKSINFFFIFFLNIFIVTWGRIIFKGKGFRIRNFQENLKLTLNFGHSHWTRIKFYNNWNFIKIRRQSYVYITYMNWQNYIFKNFFPKIKLINKYTQRGLRLKQQPIKQRFGKISQYISSLH